MMLIDYPHSKKHSQFEILKFFKSIEQKFKISKVFYHM
jgi:hypothetical protein